MERACHGPPSAANTHTHTHAHKTFGAQDFVVGQQLPYGEGVSWPTINNKAQTYVDDVATREGTVLFRCVL